MDGIEIIDYAFNSVNIKGLYCNKYIALNRNIETQIEKSCVLAEELRHHYTSVGSILDQSDPANRKQERRARLWAYDKQIGLRGIIQAYQHHRHNLSEMAKYLSVTEPFLSDALEAYRQKYGCGVNVDNYSIIFELQLAVIERFC